MLPRSNCRWTFLTALPRWVPRVWIIVQRHDTLGHVDTMFGKKTKVPTGLPAVEKFAVAVPICGGGELDKADRLKQVPIWAFHGAKDGTVPRKASQQMVDTVTNAGGNAKLTVYPEADHNSWSQTYANPEVYQWLLSHKRAK